MSFKSMTILSTGSVYICCLGRTFLCITYFCVHSKGKTTQKRTNFKVPQVLERKFAPLDWSMKHIGKIKDLKVKRLKQNPKR